MRALLGARWFPYVLIGAVTAVTAAFGWGFMKGYHKAELVYIEATNDALADQLERLTVEKDRELEAALHLERELNVLKNLVKRVPKPVASSCELAPECLQWYDNVLRTSRTD